MRILKYGSAAILGLLIAFLFSGFTSGEKVRDWYAAMAAKAVGRRVPCPWSKLITVPWSNHRFSALLDQSNNQVSILQSDEKLPIELIKTPSRSFWVKKAGVEMDGRALIAYVLAEQQWISESANELGVRPGDVVVDVGAHVGTFGDDALRRGAAKVVMIEPDPVNVECIRRNFAREIAAGTVVLVPEGAWSKADVLRFSVGLSNSGSGSFVISEPDHPEIEVAVRPLDDILQSIGVGSVQFIKMDIEGAEREALKGAARTLAHSKPRLMLDMYHRADDEFVLPRVIAAGNPGYRMVCAICSHSPENGVSRIIQYSTFFY